MEDRALERIMARFMAPLPLPLPLLPSMDCAVARRFILLNMVGSAVDASGKEVVRGRPSGAEASMGSSCDETLEMRLR